MNQNSTDIVVKEGTIFRDHLAIGRTKLANERTFLSFFRTAITLTAAGISLIKFFDFIVIHILGWIFNLASIIILTIGIKSFVKVNKLIQKENQKFRNVV